MIISERIFEIMEKRGMTQIQFSEATGISQSTISDWKRKKTNPAADKIMRICEVLEVTPYELLQDTMGIIREPKLDYKVISEGTEEYGVLMEYEKLDKASRARLFGYISALNDL